MFLRGQSVGGWGAVEPRTVAADASGVGLGGSEFELDLGGDGGLPPAVRFTERERRLYDMNDRYGQ